MKVLIILVVVVAVLVFAALGLAVRVVQQYEKGVLFRFFAGFGARGTPDSG